MAAAHGKTIDHGDHGFRDRTNLLLHLEHVQSRHSVSSDVSSAPFHVHVATGTKSLCAQALFFRLPFLGRRVCTGEHNHTNVGVFTTNAQSIRNLHDRGRSERIAIARAVDRDAGDSLELIEQNLLILKNGGPISHKDRELGDEYFKEDGTIGR